MPAKYQFVSNLKSSQVHQLRIQLREGRQKISLLFCEFIKLVQEAVTNWPKYQNVFKGPNIRKSYPKKIPIKAPRLKNFSPSNLSKLIYIRQLCFLKSYLACRVSYQKDFEENLKNSMKIFSKKCFVFKIVCNICLEYFSSMLNQRIL